MIGYGAASRKIWCGFATAATLLSVMPLVGVGLAAGADKAEYAVRWDTAEGGPKSVKKVLEALDKSADEKEEWTVQYFALTQPPGMPANFKGVLRQRKTKNEYELTFKYRGEGEFPKWTCPLSAEPAKSKEEVDVSFVPDGVKRTHSYSCSVESIGAPIPPPAELKATPKPCTAQMKRTKSGKLKIEEWNLANGLTLAEVSRKGDDTEDDLKEFEKKVVKKLVDEGIHPSDRSKTDLGGDCP